MGVGQARVVAISREFGAGGERVGALVAEQLGYRYVDEEIVAEAAAKGNVTPAEIADTEKRRSLAVRLLEQLARASTPDYSVHVVANQPPTEEYQELIRTVITETASQGSAVIVAHGASVALADRDDVLRVLVVSSPDVRARRLVEEGELDEREAERLVKSSDGERSDYFKRFYGIREQPTHYDLVLNTDSLSYEQAARVVAHAATG